MKRTITEILDSIDKLKGKKIKLAELKKEAEVNPELMYILEINFDYQERGFKGLPKGIPDGYKPNHTAMPGYADATIAGIYKKLYVYSEPNISDSRKLQLFVQDIEDLDPEEANILILAKDHTLSYKYPWIKKDAFKLIFN